MTGRVIAIDFVARRSPPTPQAEPARIRPFTPADPYTRKTLAYSMCVRGSAIDEDPSTYDEAKALYTRALALDPSLAVAATNLGNVWHRQGDTDEARRCYRTALESDLRQPEALYNLGYLAFEERDFHTAVACFKRALEGEPNFPDAHFNMAGALEELDQPIQAAEHWRAYLKLEPRGAYADLARERLYSRSRPIEGRGPKAIEKPKPPKKRRAPRKKKPAPTPWDDPYLDGMSEWIRTMTNEGRMR